MDPQLRVFLECAWEALESTGYDPETYGRPISVYAGNNISNYFIFNILPILDTLTAHGGMLSMVSHNDKDALATVVSHRLNLRGPSMSVQTFCSTSLVAVHLACQGLLAGESDMALAGGVSVSGRQVAGYFYEEGGIVSPDGHNRTFDARGKGTVFGNGAGVVVLKRLADALADGDTIHAVIRGSAVNNDGAHKAALHGAERRRAGGGHRPGAAGLGHQSRDDRLRRDARHRHVDRRSDRGAGVDEGVPRLDRQETVLFDRIGEEQLRPSRSGGGRGGPDQGRAGRGARSDSAESALRASESEDRLREQSVLREHGAQCVPAPGRAPPGGCQLVRHRGHQRARDRGGGARARRLRAEPEQPAHRALRPERGGGGAVQRGDRPVPAAAPRGAAGRRRLHAVARSPRLRAPRRGDRWRRRRNRQGAGVARPAPRLGGRGAARPLGRLPAAGPGDAVRADGARPLRARTRLPRRARPRQPRARINHGMGPARRALPGRRRGRGGAGAAAADRRDAARRLCGRLGAGAAVGGVGHQALRHAGTQPR